MVGFTLDGHIQICFLEGLRNFTELSQSLSLKKEQRRLKVQVTSNLS